MELKTYVKKPVQIKAVQLTNDNLREVAAWLGKEGNPTEPDAPHNFIDIYTLEGAMRAQIGDFIIQGIRGEFYPCKPDIFKDSYTPFQGTLFQGDPNEY